MRSQFLDAFGEPLNITLEDRSVCNARVPQINRPFSVFVLGLSWCLTLHSVKKLIKAGAVEIRESFRDIRAPEDALPSEMFRLGLGGRCSPLLAASQLFRSVHVAASGTFPAPDRSAEVWSVFVVFVAFLQSVHQIVFAPLQVSVSMVNLMFCSQVSPILKNFRRSDPDLLHLIFPLWRWAPIQNTWGVWMTLSVCVGGDAASD